jgi:hypothetical protein
MWFRLPLVSDRKNRCVLASKKWSLGLVTTPLDTSCGRSILACLLQRVPSSVLQIRSFVVNSSYCACNLHMINCIRISTRQSGAHDRLTRQIEVTPFKCSQDVPGVIEEVTCPFSPTAMMELRSTQLLSYGMQDQNRQGYR